MVTIHKVESQQDFKTFLEFPWRLYADDPHWVPPLLSMQREKLDKAKNPSWQYLEGDYYLALRDGQAVGTIAAFVNHRHNQHHNENIAWFGLFECENDPQAAQALLNTAAEWARANDYDALRGPQSFTGNDEVGVLVDGFTRPVLLMPYNKPYYQDLLESAGFYKAMDIYSFYGSWEILGRKDTDGRWARLVEKLKKRGNISTRNIDRKRLKQDFQLFKDLYNDAWLDNWGFTPMTEPELDALVESLGTFFDPRFACFGYVGDEPAGFMLGVPDFNEVLKLADPRPGMPEFITLLRAGWHWKIRPVMTWLRVPLMGVKKEFQGRGVDVAMYHHVLQQIADSPYVNVDAGWILENNDPMMKVLAGAGLERYKTHRFYEKSLTPQPAPDNSG